jgi:hypothetical protein
MMGADHADHLDSGYWNMHWCAWYFHGTITQPNLECDTLISSSFVVSFSQLIFENCSNVSFSHTTQFLTQLAAYIIVVILLPRRRFS